MVVLSSEMAVLQVRHNTNVKWKGKESSSFFLGGKKCLSDNWYAPHNPKRLKKAGGEIPLSACGEM